MAHRTARRAGRRRRRAARRFMIVAVAAAAVLMVAAVTRFTWRRHVDSVAKATHHRRADSLLAANPPRLDDAVAELREVLAIDADEPAATRQLGLLYARLAENTQAQFYLARALTHNARDIALRQRLAVVYYLSGNVDAAREEIPAPQELPDDVESGAGPRPALLRLTQRALAERQLDSALARASRVLERWPDDVEALVLRADAALAKSDTAGAARDLRHALRTAPTLPGIRVR